MIGEDLCWYWLAEASCSFGLERLDLITSALVSLATNPFWLSWQWLGDVREATELEAEFGGLQALASDGVLLL